MQFRGSCIVSTLLFVCLAAATTLLQESAGSVLHLESRQDTSIPISECDTDRLYCCNSVSPCDQPPASVILALLGWVVIGQAQCGLACSPVSIFGIGGSGSCGAQLVCCAFNETVSR
ncbi:hydrophobin 2 [Lyophyllum atratum]|nr:hydrophobin 2 [Lyophyllum atratum]